MLNRLGFPGEQPMVSDNPQHHGLRNSGETSNTPPGAEGPSTPWYQGPACKGEVKASHPPVTSKSESVMSGPEWCLLCSLQHPGTLAGSRRCSGNTICVMRAPEVPRERCMWHCGAEGDPRGSLSRCTMSLATWCCSSEDVDSNSFTSQIQMWL